MSELSMCGIKVTAEEKRVEIQHGTLITGAVLGEGMCESAPTSLTIKYANGDAGVLCTLTPGVVESVPLSLFVRPGECFTLQTTNGNAVYLNSVVDASTGGESAEQSECPESLSIVKVRSNERVQLLGRALYTACTLTASASPKVSLCAFINGSEVTLTNLIPGRIDTAEIDLEICDDAETIELFLVGEGEVDLVGYTTPDPAETYGEDAEEDDEEDDYEEDYEDDEEDCEDCEDAEEEDDDDDDDDDVCDNEYISEEQAKRFAEKENEHGHVYAQSAESAQRSTFQETEGTPLPFTAPFSTKPKPKLSKEEMKAQRKQEELKQLKIVDVRKSKSRETVKKNDKVKIRYSLYVNEKMIDRSKKGGIVFTLGENRMVRGFELGIEGMTPGSQRTITIPPQLGYKSARVGSIPPNSTLVFRVDLISILKE
ncbi:hypothetical protein NECID01_0779 [Nematocida sp. AWRm77]|nr:hypothetical protein NECID01_0779 [Nematocida sp. AWRm77]